MLRATFKLPPEGTHMTQPGRVGIAPGRGSTVYSRSMVRGTGTVTEVKL